MACYKGYMTNTDVNIRIDKSTHKQLKKLAVKYEITLKTLVALLSLSKFPIKVKNKSVEDWIKDMERVS